MIEWGGGAYADTIIITQTWTKLEPSCAFIHKSFTQIFMYIYIHKYYNKIYYIYTSKCYVYIYCIPTSCTAGSLDLIGTLMHLKHQTTTGDGE